MTEDAVEGTIQLMHEFIIQFNPKYKWRWRSQSPRLIVIIHQSWQESTDEEKNKVAEPDSGPRLEDLLQ